MKLFCLTLLVLVAGFAGGCTLDTPAYSAKERFQQIHNNQIYEQEQWADDIDHALLLRPAGRLTIWNVFHRN